MRADFLQVGENQCFYPCRISIKHPLQSVGASVRPLHLLRLPGMTGHQAAAHRFGKRPGRIRAMGFNSRTRVGATA